MIINEDWNKIQNARLLEIIGHSVRLIRLQKEISQEELSILSGVSHASIARFETGKGNISLQNLLFIMKALKMANNLSLCFSAPLESPRQIFKSAAKKPKSRVRKSQKKQVHKNESFKWGDTK